MSTCFHEEQNQSSTRIERGDEIGAQAAKPFAQGPVFTLVSVHFAVQYVGLLAETT